YRFIAQVREHYAIALDVLSPDPRLLEPLVKEQALLSFYRHGHGQCCGIPKIEPLKRKLAAVPAWATSQRRDPSPGTRR
ncbi:phosphoadenosine phosphosulfate reductase domain-containing protein, partial [Pseudomonas aeruginosa]